MEVKFQDVMVRKRLISSNYPLTNSEQKADPQMGATANVNVKTITVSHTEENPMGRKP